MKAEEFKKYCLHFTEIYFRHYYKPKPTMIHPRFTKYKIKKGLIIESFVSPVTIKDYYKKNGEILGLLIEYINEDCELETLTLKIGEPQNIMLKTGNEDVYRASLCKLDIQVFVPMTDEEEQKIKLDIDKQVEKMFPPLTDEDKEQIALDMALDFDNKIKELFK